MKFVNASNNMGIRRKIISVDISRSINSNENYFTNHDVEIGGFEIPIGRLFAHQVSKMAKTHS